MPQNIITEDHIEEEALRMLKEEGYEYIYAPSILQTTTYLNIG